MTTKTPELPDMNAMALEACDMWQEHLSNLANNPNARADMMRFLEPQRRLFADWANMMQHGSYGTGDATAESPKQEAEPEPATSTASQGDTTHGDDSLRLAQLALRLAELEKRVAQLESQSTTAAERA